MTPSTPTAMPAEMLQILEDASQPLPLPEGDLLFLYETMLMTRHLDDRTMKLQRSGRVGFFLTATGQEAAQVGSAFALRGDDPIFPAYREPGAALVRGVTPERLMAQYFGNENDGTVGRQMPVHYCFADKHYYSVSSPIGTQIIHAAGMAMAHKIKGEKRAAIAYFGDGATSSNDFHAALTFAGAYKSPAIFFCNNNGWAISLPREKQCGAESLADKGIGYGMPGVVVDGNDVLAVYRATREAAERAYAGEGPTLIEARTYRMGSHSSSDDASRYRDEAEVAAWRKKDPIVRFRKYLTDRGVLEAAADRALQEKVEREVTAAIKANEGVDPPHPRTMFADVYAEMPWHIKEQSDELLRELED